MQSSTKSGEAAQRKPGVILLGVEISTSVKAKRQNIRPLKSTESQTTNS